MKSREEIAATVLKCAVACMPEARLIGNVTAKELAFIVAPLITSCPKCGAEPWCDIDCDLCVAMSALEAEAAR